MVIKQVITQDKKREQVRYRFRANNSPLMMVKVEKYLKLRSNSMKT